MSDVYDSFVHNKRAARIKKAEDNYLRKSILGKEHVAILHAGRVAIIVLPRAFAGMSFMLSLPKKVKK